MNLDLAPDRNDCVVRAFTTAAQVRYVDAHAACELLGRRRNHGTSTSAIIDRAMDLLDRAAELKYDYLALGKKVTLGKFVKDLPAGRYVATKAGHAFSLVVEDTESGRNTRAEGTAHFKQTIRLKRVWLITPKNGA